MSSLFLAMFLDARGAFSVLLAVATAVAFGMTMMSPGGRDSKRQAIVRALRSQRRTTTFTPYYSRVRFGTALTGGGAAVSTYTIASGTEVRAFGYNIGGDMAAGGRSGVVATFADTNIVTAGRTIGGQAVEVSGISLQLQPTSLSPELVGQVWPEMSVKLSLNAGENTYLLGTPGMLPGASGLYGWENGNTGPQPIAGGRPAFGFLSNGLPGADNQAAIPEGFIWMPEGDADSTLNILLRMERAAAFTTQLPDEAAATGIRGFANPAAAAVFVDVVVRLHGRVIGPRSMVS